MNRRTFNAAVLSAALGSSGVDALAADQKKTRRSTKKVLVELFTSQG